MTTRGSLWAAAALPYKSTELGSWGPSPAAVRIEHPKLKTPNRKCSKVWCCLSSNLSYVETA